MSSERLNELEPRILQAVAELENLIRSRYPAAEFDIGPGGEDPEGTYITATVDLEDPDEVMDLVINRVLELQVEERLPVYVVPVRTPERIEQMLRERPGFSPPIRPLRF
ncbi:MAG TPA: hypothetical protein VFI42_10995 [Thermomicrobiaceae bacterium]|nr:hypothetical protein [Thermomicrobiaceae bacterium]